MRSTREDEREEVEQEGIDMGIVKSEGVNACGQKYRLQGFYNWFRPCLWY